MDQPLAPYRSVLEMRWRWDALASMPLWVFLLVVAWNDPVGTSWRVPYFLAAVISLVVTLLHLRSGVVMHRIYLALLPYFVSGSLALALDWQWLNRTYGELQATAMLLWILPVATVTMSSRAGFVGAAAGDGSRVRVYSLALVCMVVLAIGLSLATEHPLLTSYVPFVFLLVGYGWCRQQVEAAI